MPTALNYAAQYSQALANAYPYVLNFGRLYSTPNNGRYRMGENGQTIYIPHLTTSGRVDSNRDTIAMATRNYDNSWEPKTLSHHRKWSTLVHPKDIDQTNQVASIQNITQAYNEQQKFPEMDAYCISTLYSEWTEQGQKAVTTPLTKSNVLDIFDDMMEAMDEARVPANGRILYVTSAVKKLLKQADAIERNLDAQSNKSNINREVNRLDEVEIINVPSTLMKTKYDFTKGWVVADDAQQINMLLIDPNAVITPVSYEFSVLDQPSGVTEGKYLYFEESDEDVFILNERKDALQFVVSAPAVAPAKKTS